MRRVVRTLAGAVAAGACVALVAAWLAPDNVLAVWTLLAFCH